MIGKDFVQQHPVDLVNPVKKSSRIATIKKIEEQKKGIHETKTTFQ